MTFNEEDIKLLEELQNKEAVSKFSSPLSGKNLPFSSLSEDLKNKEKLTDLSNKKNDETIKDLTSRIVKLGGKLNNDIFVIFKNR